MARPQKKVDEKLLVQLARLHCTGAEMSAILGVSVDTLDRRYADVIAKGRNSAKRRLRRVQWQTAMKGNVVMQIWLGKQMLGQSETQPAEATDLVKALTALAARLPV